MRLPIEKNDVSPGQTFPGRAPPYKGKWIRFLTGKRVLPGLAPRLRDFSPHPLNPWLPAAGGWGEPKAPVPASAPSATTSPPWLRPARRLRASPRLSLCRGGTVSRSPTFSDCEPPPTEQREGRSGPRARPIGWEGGGGGKKSRSPFPGGPPMPVAPAQAEPRPTHPAPFPGSLPT